MVYIACNISVTDSYREMIILRSVRPLPFARKEIMIIRVHHGRTGAGKSRAMKRSIITRRGCHVLVVPRKNSINECYDDLLTLARAIGIKLSIRKLFR